MLATNSYDEYFAEIPTYMKTPEDYLYNKKPNRKHWYNPPSDRTMCNIDIRMVETKNTTENAEEVTCEFCQETIKTINPSYFDVFERNQ